jgi:hypothetical protein
MSSTACSADQGPAVDHELDGVQRGLVAVEQVEPLGSVAGDLAAQLGADGSAGTGHEHPAPGEVAGDLVDADVDLVAAEQVLEVDVADVGDVHLAVDDPGQRREHLDRHVGSVGVLDDPPHGARRDAGDRDDDDLRARLGHGSGQVLAAPDHGDP